MTDSMLPLSTIVTAIALAILTSSAAVTVVATIIIVIIIVIIIARGTKVSKHDHHS